MNTLRLANNPLDGILPNFSIFGAEFTALWQKLLAGVWGIAIVIAIVFLIIGITSMSTATAGSNPQEYKTGRAKAIWAAIALALLAALAVLVGALLSFVG